MKKSIAFGFILFVFTAQSASASKHYYCVPKSMEKAEALCRQKCSLYGGFDELAASPGYGGDIPDEFIKSCLSKNKIACGCKD